MDQTLITVLVCTSCVGSEEAASRTEAINYADYEDVIEPYDYPAVVQVGGSCTGTLITQNHVLTAAHCVAESAPGSVSFAATGQTPELTIGVARCFMYPGFIAINRDRLTVPFVEGMDACGVFRRGDWLRESDSARDFAVLQLARPVPHAYVDPAETGAGPVQVSPIPLAGDAPALGELVAAIAVGFGRTENETDAGTRRVKAVNVELDGSLFNTTALNQGDSGGPLLRERFGQMEIMGVASVEGRWASIFTGAFHTWVESRIDTDGDGRHDTYCPDGRRGANPAGVSGNDVDGDGYLDHEDVCPDTYNPCQATTDADGDGIYDGCDACPGDAEVAEPRGTLEDDDQDGWPNVCDCEPELFGLDYDFDYISDHCDNCVLASNTNQENRDGDAMGDACDRCPDVADYGVDADNDGIPDACDNCPTIPNASQANCNFDVEQQLWRDSCPPDVNGVPSCPPSEYVAGDVCDPTPCGETQLGREVLGSRAEREVVENAVRVDARAQSTKEGRTGFRFCRCSFATRDRPAARQDCILPHVLAPPEEADDESVEIGSCGLRDLVAYDASAEPENWRWITTAYAASATDPRGPRSTPELHGERSLSYEPVPGDGARFSTNLWASWNLRDDDAPRWRTQLSEPIADGMAANLPGVLWTHTPGPPSGGSATEWERELASHFWSGRVQMPTQPPLPFLEPLPCFQAMTPWIGEGTFGPAPVPWVGFVGPCGDLGPPTEIAVRLGLDSFPRQLAFDPPWLIHFEDLDIEWVPVAESGDWLGDGGLRYVGIDGNGSGLRALLVEQEGELVDVLDGAPCVEEGCLDLIGPTASRLFVASAREGTLWSIGRTLGVLAELPFDDEEGGPHLLGERARVLAFDVHTRELRSLEPEGAWFGHVLAATYVPREGALFVWDELPVEEQSSSVLHRRLLRVELTEAAAHATVIWQLDAQTETEYALAAAPDGTLFVGARSNGVVCRFESDSEGGYVYTGSVTVWHAGISRPIAAGGLRADEHGLTVVAHTQEEGGLPVVLKPEEFEPSEETIWDCL